MKSYDFKAVIYEGEVYCMECLPEGVPYDDWYPIFADSEWDYAPCCDKCGKVHDYMTILEEQ